MCGTRPEIGERGDLLDLAASGGTITCQAARAAHRWRRRTSAVVTVAMPGTEATWRRTSSTLSIESASTLTSRSISPARESIRVTNGTAPYLRGRFLSISPHQAAFDAVEDFPHNL